MQVSSTAESNYTTISLLSNFVVANLQVSLKTFDVLHRDQVKHHVTKRSIDDGSRAPERVLEFTTLGRYRRLLKGTGGHRAKHLSFSELNSIESTESVESISSNFHFQNYLK